MKKSARNYIRTIVIGTLSLAALVWLAVWRFRVDWAELLELLAVTGLLVVLVISVAASAALVWVGLRKLLRGQRGRD